MNYTLVTDRKESQRAFETFKRTFAVDSHVFKDVQRGWQGGGSTIDAIYLHKKYNLWGIINAAPPVSVYRECFWMPFGIGNPEKNAALVVEINPPHEGINKRLGGAFLKDEKGNVYLAHTGKVGGGRKGIGQDSFIRYCEQQKCSFLTCKTFLPDLGKNVFIVGNVEDKKIVQKISEFVHLVHDFKEFAVLENAA
jgi:hypothetical protein